MLSPRAALSLAGAAALVLSLGLKAQTLDMVGPDVARYNRELAVLLANQGFVTGLEDRPTDMDVVLARRGSCRLRLRADETADRIGNFRYTAGGLPLAGWRYRGQVRREFPRGAYEVRRLVQRAGLRLGLTDAVERPLAIAASPDCDLAAIDFGPQRIHRVNPAPR